MNLLMFSSLGFRRSQNNESSLLKRHYIMMFKNLADNVEGELYAFSIHVPKTAKEAVN